MSADNACMWNPIYNLHLKVYKHCVYSLIPRGKKRVVYVGVTCNPRHRLAEHNVYRESRKKAFAMRIEKSFRSRRQALKYETLLLGGYRKMKKCYLLNADKYLYNQLGTPTKSMREYLDVSNLTVDEFNEKYKFNKKPIIEKIEKRMAHKKEVERKAFLDKYINI